MPNEEIQPDKKEVAPKPRKGVKVLAAIAIAGTLIGGVSEAYTSNALYIPRAAAQYVESYFGRTNSEALASVNDALDHPDNADLLRLDIITEDYDEAFKKLCMEKATENGLTLIDPKPYQEEIKQAKSIDEIVAIENKFLENYGIHLYLGYKPSVKDIGFKYSAFDKTATSLDKMKEVASSLAGSLYYMPVEVAKLSNVKEIVFVGRLYAHDGNAMGQENAFTGRAYYSQDHFENFDFRLICHEISHGLDSTLNGPISYFSDPEYEKLNKPGFKYGDLSKYKEGGDIIDEYAMTNVGEDKASMMESMINGLSVDLVLSRNPTLRAKYRLLLARLEEKVPGVTRYYAATGIDPSLTSWAIEEEFGGQLSEASPK